MPRASRHLFGLERLAVYKHICSWRTMRALAHGVTRYLDEVTKENYQDIAELSFPDAVRQVEEHVASSVEYVGHRKGGLHVYGWLRSEVELQAWKRVGDMDAQELDDAVLGSWLRCSRRFPRRKDHRWGHHFVLALNPQLCARLAKLRIDGDKLLLAVVRKLFRRYQEKFYPGEKITYVCGIHHDKAHLHIHILLFPRSASGKMLRVTDEGRARRGRRIREFLRERAVALVGHEVERALGARRRKGRNHDIEQGLLAHVALAAHPANAFESSSEDLLARRRARIRVSELDEPQRKEVLLEVAGRQQRRYRALVDSSELRENYRGLANDTHQKSLVAVRDLQGELCLVSKRIDDAYSRLDRLRRDHSAWRRVSHPQPDFDSPALADYAARANDWLLSRAQGGDELARVVRKDLWDKAQQILPYEFARTLAAGDDPILALATIADRPTRKALRWVERERCSDRRRLERFLLVAAKAEPRQDRVGEFLKSEFEQVSGEIRQLSAERTSIYEALGCARLYRDTAKFDVGLVRAADQGENLNLSDYFADRRPRPLEDANAGHAPMTQSVPATAAEKLTEEICTILAYLRGQAPWPDPPPTWFVISPPWSAVKPIETKPALEPPRAISPEVQSAEPVIATRVLRGIATVSAAGASAVPAPVSGPVAPIPAAAAGYSQEQGLKEPIDGPLSGDKQPDSAALWER